MAIDFYWGSGSSPCWRVALALEFKRLKYNSHLLHFDLQEHKSPQMLAMNFRGRLPVLRDNDYVVFESLAILYYLDQKYRDPPIFGRNAEEAGVIMRVICEYQSYAEPPLKQIVAGSRQRRVDDGLAEAMHRVAGEARTIEQRLAHSDWVVGESFSAADMMIYPDIRRCCARCSRRKRTNWRRASCRWRSTTRRSGAGSIAWRHCPGTSAPGRHTGAEGCGRSVRRRQRTALQCQAAGVAIGRRWRRGVPIVTLRRSLRRNNNEPARNTRRFSRAHRPGRIRQHRPGCAAADPAASGPERRAHHHRQC